MVLEVLKFPDPRLRRKGVAVKSVTPELKQLVADMIETMYDHNGIGLAAPQVGQSIRLLVMDTRPRDEDGNIVLDGMTELERKVTQPIVIFNPEIVEAREKTTYEEGCLSVPGIYETVERNLFVKVKGLDGDGKDLLIETDGLLAICLQHEMDHLEGKLFIDRLSFMKSSRIKNRIQKHGYPTQEEVAEDRARVREHRRQQKAAAKEGSQTDR